MLALAGYFYFFQRQSLQRLLEGLSDAPPVWAYVVYLALGCIRGFTLVPATYLVVAGLLVLPPLPLFALTVAGILVSSAAVYYFAEAMRFDRFFERRYPTAGGPASGVAGPAGVADRDRLELLSPRPDRSDLLRVRRLKVDLKKCLLGVALGEGAICAIYIFFGAQALAWLR